MTIVNNLKSSAAIAKVSDLVDNVCEYFEIKDEIDECATFIEVEEHGDIVSIRIDRTYYIKIQNKGDTSLRDLIKLAKDMSVEPDGESITISMSIPF